MLNSQSAQEVVRVCSYWLSALKEGEGQEMKANGFTTTKMIHLPKSNCSVRKFSYERLHQKTGRSAKGLFSEEMGGCHTWHK